MVVVPVVFCYCMSAVGFYFSVLHISVRLYNTPVYEKIMSEGG